MFGRSIVKTEELERLRRNDEEFKSIVNEIEELKIQIGILKRLLGKRKGRSNTGK
jgi:hypothetical protein